MLESQATQAMVLFTVLILAISSVVGGLKISQLTQKDHDHDIELQYLRERVEKLEK